MNIAAMREASRTEAAALVRLVAEPRGGRGTVTRCIERAATRLGWSYRRTEAIWYRETKRIEAHEIDQLPEMTQRQRAGVPAGIGGPTGSG